MEKVVYKGAKQEVSWQGIEIQDGDQFSGFLASEVSERVEDAENIEELSLHLRGLASAGFETENLEAILNAEVDQDRDWAIGESLAEVWLANAFNIVWPWNHERDKRNPFASLPGADLVGFIKRDEKCFFAVGEVKSSSDATTPPSVMSGRSGMVHQLQILAEDLGLLCQLIKWLWPRCKNSSHQDEFDSACKQLFKSGNKAISLFGVLVRDTESNELDLKNRGVTLSNVLTSPTDCNLVALYLPCKISDLPKRLASGGGL